MEWTGAETDARCRLDEAEEDGGGKEGGGGGVDVLDVRFRLRDEDGASFSRACGC